MQHFWSFARAMLRHRAMLAVALLCATVSAGGLGAGILSLGPLLKAILKPDGHSLVEQAHTYNDSDPVVQVPAWVIERLPEDPFKGVVLILVGIAVLTIFGNVAGFFHEYLAATVSTRAISRIRLVVFRAVMRRSLSAVMLRGSSEYVSRVVRDTVELQRGFYVLVSKSVTQVTKGTAAFIAAVILQWQLVLVSIVVAPLLAIILRKIGTRIRRGTRGALKAQEGLLRVSHESVAGLRTVKVNTGELLALRRFHRENLTVLHEELRVRVARAFGSPLIETLALLVILALAAFAAKQIITGDLTFERFSLSLAALGIAGSCFKPLTALVNDIQAAAAPAERLGEILAEHQEVANIDAPRLPRHHRSIEFVDLSFRYPSAEVEALSNVNLNVLHGEKVAIVGPNGCGKTTLLSMVPRLLDPVSGSIRIDGTNIAEVNLRSLRDQIAVVTQETVLLKGSIRENITFGRRGVTREMIDEAIRDARAESFIRELPGGLDAPVAEHGASLSGGQRQRIAIARAILRNPAILILDEATSQIDAESEHQINAALDEFCRGRTTLIIAHRLSTVLSADRIVVMDAGRIVDSGLHDQLLGRCDVYRRLASTQLMPAAV